MQLLISFSSHCVSPLHYTLLLQQFPPALTTHRTSSSSSCYCSVTCSTNTPVPSTDQTSTTIPLAVLLVVVNVTLLVSASYNIALWFRVKRQTETIRECKHVYTDGYFVSLQLSNHLFCMCVCYNYVCFSGKYMCTTQRDM